MNSVKMRRRVVPDPGVVRDNDVTERMTSGAMAVAIPLRP